jgi:hypothetical protein
MSRYLLLVVCLFVVVETLAASQTPYAVFVVSDGARYTETFGDATLQYNPQISNTLRLQSTLYTKYYNNGATETCPWSSKHCPGHGRTLSTRGASISVCVTAAGANILYVNLNKASNVLKQRGLEERLRSGICVGGKHNGRTSSS